MCQDVVRSILLVEMTEKSTVQLILEATRTAAPSQAKALKGVKVVIRDPKKSDTSRYDPASHTILLRGRPRGDEGLGVLKHELGHAILQKRYPLDRAEVTAKHHKILQRAGLGVTDSSTAGAAGGRLSSIEDVLKKKRKWVMGRMRGG